jgi:hypothetical protein
MTCDFTVIRLANVDSVQLRLTIVNDNIVVDYQGEPFDVLCIDITSGISRVTFSATQTNPQCQAEGRHWCRSDDDPWVAWEQSGTTLTYSADVPASVGTDMGYELRFSLHGWLDPKVIISRKGQKV